MKRMYLAGADVVGPISPRRWRICVLSMVNSQSSMNSHRCRREDSVVSGTCFMRLIMVLTIDRLNSKPPSSLKKFDRNPTRTRCLLGYVRHRRWRDRTILILNSSGISPRKTEICLRSRSMLFSLPVLRSVVMARVAMDRFASEISPSRSSLHLATMRGCDAATTLTVFMAAKRTDGFELDRNSCSTVMAGLSSCGSMLGSAHMALAASYTTISDLWRRLASRNA
mmetsp:Transcript_16442/g.38124  ORF Transcript_16442/g.38124 Transcript_16442/m.38124 type:complete len:225 (+) Transcript_16442:1468-2142(+)